ncbi:hypothetical protein M885DRAFT_280854 [Pelagophyceae sp. CCMP2097]|nr:hypothetical protein M885DRAFT_280854 [Pelagophyceae sp. CCMP2097]
MEAGLGICGRGGEAAVAREAVAGVEVRAVVRRGWCVVGVRVAGVWCGQPARFRRGADCRLVSPARGVAAGWRIRRRRLRPDKAVVHKRLHPVRRCAAGRGAGRRFGRGVVLCTRVRIEKRAPAPVALLRTTVVKLPRRLPPDGEALDGLLGGGLTQRVSPVSSSQKNRVPDSSWSSYQRGRGAATGPPRDRPAQRAASSKALLTSAASHALLASSATAAPSPSLSPRSTASSADGAAASGAGRRRCAAGAAAAGVSSTVVRSSTAVRWSIAAHGDARFAASTASTSTLRT